MTSYESKGIAGLDIDITVISGRDLVPKDKNLITRKKTTSDVSPRGIVYFIKK